MSFQIKPETRAALESMSRKAFGRAYNGDYEPEVAMIHGQEIQCRIGKASRGFGGTHWKVNGDRASWRSVVKQLAWQERPVHEVAS